METSVVAIPHKLQTATDQMVKVLLNAEPISAYRQALADFESDLQAQQLLDQLADAQADLRSCQRDGSVTQADVDHLRDCQRQATSNHIIICYVEAQQMANDYLLAINQAISELIGVDFGKLARPPQSCP